MSVSSTFLTPAHTGELSLIEVNNQTNAHRQITPANRDGNEQSLLRLWHTNVGTVKLFIDHQHTFSAEVFNARGKSTIHESSDGFATLIGLPSRLRQSPSLIHLFLAGTYVQGVPFQDSYKLYIQPRLQGGMLEAGIIPEEDKSSLRVTLSKSESDIEAQIKQKLPSHTYESVHVAPTTCDFNGLRSPPVKTRKITLTLKKLEWIFSGFHGVLAGLGLIPHHKYDQETDLADLQKEMMNLLTEKSTSNTQIRSAYDKSQTIEFWISEDLRNFQLKISTSLAEYAYLITPFLLKIAQGFGITKALL